MRKIKHCKTADFDRAVEKLEDSRLKLRDSITDLHDAHKELAKDKKTFKKIDEEKLSDLEMAEVSLKQNNKEIKKTIETIKKKSSAYFGKGDIVRLPKKHGENSFEIKSLEGNKYHGEILENEELKSYSIPVSDLDHHFKEGEIKVVHKTKESSLKKAVKFLETLIK